MADINVASLAVEGLSSAFVGGVISHLSRRMLIRVLPDGTLDYLPLIGLTSALAIGSAINLAITSSTSGSTLARLYRDSTVGVFGGATSMIGYLLSKRFIKVA